MIPGVNPRQLKQVMKQMGMSQEDFEATQVIVKTPTKTLVFDNPDLQKVTMQGQVTFQLVGEYTESQEPVAISISEDDIETVIAQAQVSKEEAMKALDESDGDIAQAIINLSE